jgi:hypothetical protein
MAAAGLTALGRIEGLDSLAASIDDDAYVRGSEPPISVGQFAAATLKRYTGQADIADVQAWQAWLDANRDGLTFDPEQQLWTLP